MIGARGILPSIEGYVVAKTAQNSLYAANFADFINKFFIVLS
jgi:hypothetical protein